MNRSFPYILFFLSIARTIALPLFLWWLMRSSKPERWQGRATLWLAGWAVLMTTLNSVLSLMFMVGASSPILLPVSRSLTTAHIIFMCLAGIYTIWALVAHEKKEYLVLTGGFLAVALFNIALTHQVAIKKFIRNLTPIEKRLVSSNAGVQFDARIDLQEKNEGEKRRVLSKLLETLKSPDPEIRAAAADGIAACMPVTIEVLPILIDTLNDPHYKVRTKAEWAIMRIGSPVAPALIEVLENKNQFSDLRVVVARTLGELVPPADSAGPVLTKRLQDKSELMRVRVSAASALGQWAVQRRDVNAPANPADLQAAVRALISVIEENDRVLCSNAAIALGRFRGYGEAIIPALIKLLSLSPDPIVRQSSISSIGDFGDEAHGALPLLEQATSDSDGKVRLAAQEAVRKIQSAMSTREQRRAPTESSATISGDFNNFGVFAITLEKSGKVILYAGLPNHLTDQKYFDQETKTKATVSLHGYKFYAEPVTLEGRDMKTLINLFKEKKSFKPYSGLKRCFGFHPDFGLEWHKGPSVYRALLCFGCSEAEMYGPESELYCDIGDLAAFRGLLKPYQRTHR